METEENIFVEIKYETSAFAGDDQSIAHQNIYIGNASTAAVKPEPNVDAFDGTQCICVSIDK